MFEDVRQEQSLILLLALTDPDILNESEYTSHEVYLMKNFALERFHRQRILKEYVAVSLTE